MDAGGNDGEVDQNDPDVAGDRHPDDPLLEPVVGHIAGHLTDERRPDHGFAHAVQKPRYADQGKTRRAADGDIARPRAEQPGEHDVPRRHAVADEAHHDLSEAVRDRHQGQGETEQRLGVSAEGVVHCDLRRREIVPPEILDEIDRRGEDGHPPVDTGHTRFSQLRSVHRNPLILSRSHRQITLNNLDFYYTIVASDLQQF